jgi:phage gpG-like protein
MINNTDAVINRIKQRGVIMNERQTIQKRIRFLQRSLVQMSFGVDKDRPALYSSLMRSLHLAQKSLLENRKIERNMNYGK